MQRDQLELQFNAPASLRPLPSRERRSSGARWWFQQMYRVVDRAIDWREARPSRPEQISLSLAVGSQ